MTGTVVFLSVMGLALLIGVVSLARDRGRPSRGGGYDPGASYGGSYGYASGDPDCRPGDSGGGGYDGGGGGE